MNHLKSLDLNSSIDLIDSSGMIDGVGEKERLLREKQYEVGIHCELFSFITQIIC